MVETKVVSKVRKSEDIKKEISTKDIENFYMKQAVQGFKTFDSVLSEIYWLIEEKVIYFSNKEVMFFPEFALLMGMEKGVERDVEELDIEMLIKEKPYICNQWETEFLNSEEVKGIYSEELRWDDYLIVLCTQGNLLGYGRYDYYTEDLCFDTDLYYSFNDYVLVPFGYHFDKKKTFLEMILEIGIPKTLEENSLARNLYELKEKGYIDTKQDRFYLTKSGKQALMEGKIKSIGSVVINTNYKGQSSKQEEMQKINADNISGNVFSYYSDCDKIRAGMGSYDLAWLEDPNQGHWELWDVDKDPESIELEYKNKIYARNPKSDIKADCIVGIDFGTKSTVVVCQNESGMTQPMPICGDIRKKLEQRDFENPTVMQFIDFHSFIKSYREKEGRPYTKWEDVTISHTANESMKDTGVRSAEFYSYLYDLKQWAGDGEIRINLRDKKGEDIVLDSYDALSQSEDAYMDPIEIYAYYIGLYINNMNNGIYLDYLLSFPVTYEKKVRNAILNSFEKGLKKSLPQSILEDEEVMNQFHVVAGASEPAAYAICALEEYGFDPEEDEKIFYGIFDFGGGTTDFDFGLWTKSEDEDLFDYCIEHFGTQGDRYLGGENLLQLLAYKVFTDNMDICRKEKIPFAKPNEFINVPAEYRGYVNDSQEARMNQKLMMEKLRPFWECNNEELMEEFEEFQISLFDVNGSLKPNLPFETQTDQLEEILEKRIKKGVKQFFEALKDIFAGKHLGKTANVDKIHIFLAGNSSKSPILQKAFEEMIQKWDEEIVKSQENGETHFILFPPLGTEEAIQIQKERGVYFDSDFSSPTGKTGVAWGLIEGREGGRIEVKEEITFESEAKFAYYLGIRKGKFFSTKIRRDDEYSKWMKFIPAKRAINEIYYTSLPGAASEKLPYFENGIFRKRIELPVTGENYFVYIRLVETDTIEIGVGESEDKIMEETIRREKF